MSAAPESSSSSTHKLVIKAANQKYDDFIIEQFELDWTIKRLKQHLNSSYPMNPVDLTTF